jgi:hypothetical protein
VKFDTAKTDAAHFTPRRGHKKHLHPELTAKLRVGNRFVRINRETTRWLGFWMDPHLSIKEHHNRSMKKARAAVARLWSLTGVHGVVPA